MEKQNLSPVFWVPSLYFAMGIPFVTINAVSVLMYKNLGISDGQITFWTALIMLPWTLKPLWSPFLEIFKTKKFFVVSTQLLTGVLFVFLALSLPLPGFFRYSIAFFAFIALSGATHDIAADGVYLNLLSSKQQAEFIGWQGAFYNLAKIVSGGLLVYVAGILEKSKGILFAWILIMLVYGGIMLLLALYHAKILPAEKQQIKQKKSFGQIKIELCEVMSSFFSKPNITLSIVFILLYRFAEGFAIKVAPLFFKSDIKNGGLGLSTENIGMIYGTFGSAAFVLGSILAGYFISFKGLRKALIWLCLAFNAPFAVYALLAFYLPSDLFFIGIAVVVEYFGYGFGFVGLMLYIMQQVAPGKHKMAHYAFATGIMNFGVMIPGMLSGILSDWLGYKMFFIWVLIATIPAFIITLKLPFSFPENSSDNNLN